MAPVNSSTHLTKSTSCDVWLPRYFGEIETISLGLRFGPKGGAAADAGADGRGNPDESQEFTSQLSKQVLP